jgi:tetratricopeptide (TPR) repeat protein
MGAGGFVADLTLTVTDYAGPSRWRWKLTAPDGSLIADHNVQLDGTDWRYEAFCDLRGYLLMHVAPDRRTQRESKIVAEVGDWAGSEVLGDLGTELLQATAAAPVTVRVTVPGEPPAARRIAYLPLELAHADGRPLALQGVTLVMQVGPDGRCGPKSGVGDRLRVLALFSAPDGQRPLSLRRERVALTRLFDEVVHVHGRAVDLRVLQYGVTRDRLREVLQEAEGWDIIHVSGHGQPGELLLETEDGSPDPVGGSHLADMLYLARERLKLVTVSACSSAALTTEQQLRLLGVHVPAAPNDLQPDSSQPAGGAVADELALRLDCAVLAMRYPVVDDFAIGLTEKLYHLIADSGQPVPTALGLALRELIKAPASSCPALSVATPTLFGARASGLVLAAPHRRTPVSYGPGMFKLAGFPPPPDRFAGRVALMACANMALAPRSGSSGLLLHGMPGGGKTACALELAHTHEHAFEDFVWYQAPDEGHDVAAALTGFALALENALPGVKMVHLLDDRQGLAEFWPVLMELCERRRVMFVIDNAESLLTERGQWRDPRWAEAAAALSGHSGLSRLMLTSRVRPANLVAEMRTEQVGALPLAEALLLARELPRLAALMEGTTPGIAATDAQALARRALECAQGHPKLLELADGTAGDPAALRAMLNEIASVWRRQGSRLAEFPESGETAADADSYWQVLAAWTRSAAALVSADARDMFWFLCCLEEADRTSKVVGTTWPQVRTRLGRQTGPLQIDSLLAELSRQALTTIRAMPGTAVDSFGIQPAVAAAGRTTAGADFQAAVDTEQGSYWIAVSRIAVLQEINQGTGADVVTAGLRAVPYLLRIGRPDDALALLEDALARDHSRTTIAAALPWLRELATALRGQPNETAAVGTLARTLRLIDPAAAENVLVSVLDAAVGRGDYARAFVASDDLGELMRESGRLETALFYAEQSHAFAVRAELGPWTRLTAERSRLLVLLEQGHAEQVLTEVRNLADRAANLPPEPGNNEIVTPWMTEESLADTGRATALRLGSWSDALAYNSTAMTSMRRRGAPAADLARARFGDYGPLLSLGRTGDAFDVLQECKAAAEQDRDIEMLGVIFGALAEHEDARGHRDVAAERCKDSLRYMYIAGNPADVAGGHARLGNYIGRGGVSHAGAITQFLAAALVHELSGTRQGNGPVSAAAAHLRAAQDEAMLPASVAELYVRVQDVPGCGLTDLLSRIWPDEDAVERTYQEIVQRVRALAAQPHAASARVAAVQWDPIIATLQAAMDGNVTARDLGEHALSGCSQAGREALATALRRILAGDLDAASLARNLDGSDAAIVGRALDAIEGRVEIPRVLWRAAPIAGLLLDLVMACRGAPRAPARVRQALGVLNSRQEWSALVPVLERILAGERDAILLGDLTDPVHRAVVALVLKEIARTGPSDIG